MSKSVIKAINTYVETYKYKALVIYLHRNKRSNQPKKKQNLNQKNKSNEKTRN